MIRKLTPHLAVLAAALMIVLGSATSGCGGGSGGSNGGSTGTTGTDGTVTDAAGIVRDIYSKPATGAKVTFFSSTGSKLGTTTITSNGEAGTPPSGSTNFSVDVSPVPAYYATYLYDGLNYDATIANCYPKLTNGAFASSIVLTPKATGQAPPAPDGCVGG